ncbi:MAG: hypothetical protein R3B84_03350 [Zavarzinella sp.]
MRRRSNGPIYQMLYRTGMRLISSLPMKYRAPLFGLVLIIIVVVLVVSLSGCPAPGQRNGNSGRAPQVGEMTLAVWNVENLYDDQDDPKVHDDSENWFAANPDMFRTKVNRVAEGLLKINEGSGPDIACLIEVESIRCMEAVKDAMNAKLRSAGRADQQYTHVVFLGDRGGRFFAPGYLSRIPALGDRTRTFGARTNGRVLEGHFQADGQELVILSGHWTSRVTDKDEDGSRRMSYANDCYGRLRAILTANPDAEVIVCGDFNDEFNDASLQQGLKVSRSTDTVRDSLREPRLLALFADWNGDPSGTVYGRGNWAIFDHICVSRGLLDGKGWQLVPNSANIFAPPEMRFGKKQEPFRFGGDKHTGERGFSDHFPLTARFRIAK